MLSTLYLFSFFFFQSTMQKIKNILGYIAQISYINNMIMITPIKTSHTVTQQPYPELHLHHRMRYRLAI